MNAVTVTGVLAGDTELRTIESGRQLMNIEILVDGSCPGESPNVRCCYFPRNGDVREIKVGTRILVVGALRHRRDVGRLFIAVSELFIFPKE